MRRHRTILLLVFVALAGAVMVTQMQSCGLMDGGPHVVTTCQAGILPVAVTLGLASLSFVILQQPYLRSQLVLLSIDRPPRRPRAR